MMDTQLNELKQDIQYFEQLNFVNLANKFKRDLQIIEHLKQSMKDEAKNL